MKKFRYRTCSRCSRQIGLNNPCKHCAKVRNSKARQIDRITERGKPFPWQYGMIVDYHHFVYTTNDPISFTRERLKMDGRIR